MNIEDVFPLPHEVPPLPNTDGFKRLLIMRIETFQGFAKVEEGKGFIRPHASLALPDGQDMLRLMMMRGFEELYEAGTAIDPKHKLEELIDAFNFFWSVTSFDAEVPLDFIIHGLIEGWEQRVDSKISPYDILCEMFTAIGALCETLRNRSWQQAPQSTYFDGWRQLHNYYKSTTKFLAAPFTDWTEFARYFIAKDRVLQFRLESKY